MILLFYVKLKSLNLKINQKIKVLVSAAFALHRLNKINFNKEKTNILVLKIYFVFINYSL